MLQSWKGRFGLEVEPVVLFWVEPGTIWWTRTLSLGVCLLLLFLILLDTGRSPEKTCRFTVTISRHHADITGEFAGQFAKRYKQDKLN